jgi:hypothetical protein
MHERLRSWIWDPLDDPKLEEGSPIPSKTIKEVVLCFILVALSISIVLIAVCGRSGPNDLRWYVALIWIGIVWGTMGIITLGLFASHPCYWSRMVGCWMRIRCKRDNSQESGDNPLFDATDLEISLEE